jgi:hypothetical protein
MQRMQYNESNIELLRNIIVNYLSYNDDAGYSIRIDGTPVTPRTQDKRMFDLVNNQLNEFNKTLTLVIFPNKSFNTIQYELMLNGYEESLSGTETKSPKEDLAEMRRQITLEIEYTFMKKENDSLKRENNLLRSKISEVEILVHSAQNKSGSQLMDMVKTIAGLLMGNPSGLSLPEAGTTAQPIEGVPASTIKVKGETTTENEATTKAAELAKTLQRFFSEHEQEQILQVLAVLKDTKDLIPAVSVWLSDIIEQRKQLIERLTAEQQVKSTVKPETTTQTNPADTPEMPANV